MPKNIDKSIQLVPGEVAISWLNSHSSIMVRTAAATLIFDPLIEIHGLPDAIVVTHEHSDHFDPKLLRRYQEAGVTIIANTFVTQRLPGRTITLNDGSAVSFGDIKLIASRCEHPANDPLAFLILVDDGPAVYHPSDSEPFVEMAELGERHKPDVLLYSGNSIEKAHRISALVKPQVILSTFCDRIWAEAFQRRMDSWQSGRRLWLLEYFEVWLCSGRGRELRTAAARKR